MTSMYAWVICMHDYTCVKARSKHAVEAIAIEDANIVSFAEAALLYRTHVR